MPAKTYVASTGETPDAIAKRLWGDERLFQYLVDANPSLRGVISCQGGEVLAVPEITVPATSVLPPWRRS